MSAIWVVGVACSMLSSGLAAHWGIPLGRWIVLVGLFWLGTLCVAGGQS